jgi:hypothetical protein
LSTVPRPHMVWTFEMFIVVRASSLKYMYNSASNAVIYNVFS